MITVNNSIIIGSLAKFLTASGNIQTLEFTRSLFIKLAAQKLIRSGNLAQFPAMSENYHYFDEYSNIMFMEYDTKSPKETTPKFDLEYDRVEILLSGSHEMEFFAPQGSLPQDCGETGQVMSQKRPPNKFLNGTGMEMFCGYYMSDTGTRVHATPARPLVFYIPAGIVYATGMHDPMAGSSRNTKLIMSFKKDRQVNEELAQFQIGAFIDRLM